MKAIKSASRLAAILAALALVQTVGVSPSIAKSAKATPKSATKAIVGKIVAFDCGDNCYLTVQTAEGTDVVGLCHAPQCAPWVEEQAMPKAMFGRKVRATVGMGKQTDGAGNVMGETEAFTALKFVK